MKKPSKKTVTEYNIEIAKRLRSIILRCLRTRSIPDFFRKTLNKFLDELDLFLKNPQSKTFLSNIDQVIEIIIKIINILEILGK